MRHRASHHQSIKLSYPFLLIHTLIPSPLFNHSNEECTLSYQLHNSSFFELYHFLQKRLPMIFFYKNTTILYFLIFVRMCTAFTPTFHSNAIFPINTSLNERKPGVSSPEELRKFVNNAGSRLVVIDVREPDDVITDTPCKCNRPRALNAVWDRNSGTMNLPIDFPKDTPIITHCNSK